MTFSADWYTPCKYPRHFDDKYKAVALNMSWDFDRMSLVSISAYNKVEFARVPPDGHVGIGQDNADIWRATGAALGRFNEGALDPTIIQDYHSEVKSWSQELRLLSSWDGPLSWMIGGMYAQDGFIEDRFTVS